MAFQGSLRELPLPDIIQLVAVSGKTGAFLIEDGEGDGRIYLRDGQIVHAETGGLSGEEAIYELATWTKGDFKFDTSAATNSATIDKSNTNLLMEAARRQDEWKVLEKKVPSVNMVPVFADQVEDAGVSFTPREWRVVRKIDERRDIEAISAQLEQSTFDVAKVIYGLITAGIISLQAR